MFGTIRKHQTWLWAVIITLTIISFVIFFSPYSKMNSRGVNEGYYGSIFGQRVTRLDFANAQREVDLHNFFMTGHFLSEDRKRAESDVQREVYHWLLLTRKQEQLGIHVSEETAAQTARQMVRSLDKSGQLTPAMFIERVLPREGLTADDLERFIRHFIGIQEIISTVGLSGKLITPQDAKALYEREEQQVATEAVFFTGSNYLASVQVSPQAISQYYSNRVANYVIPERVQVSYVKFELTNYLNQAQTDLKSNLTDIVEENFQRLGTNVWTRFPEAKTPDEAKAKIREQVIRFEARKDAQKKATDFDSALYDMKPESSENLRTLAAKEGLAVAVTAPFDRQDVPKGLEVEPDFTKAAFEVTPDEPFTSPIVAEDGVYVIAFNKRIPSEIPPLDQIRNEVQHDFQNSQAVEIARQKGQEFQQTLTNGLAHGQSFTNLCAQAHIRHFRLPPFSLSTRSLPDVKDTSSMDLLKRAAFSTQPGQTSDFLETRQGGMILYVRAKLPLDQERMQAELPEFVKAVRQRRQQEAFDEWFSREAQVGLRDTPVARPPTPALGSAGAAKS